MIERQVRRRGPTRASRRTRRFQCESLENRSLLAVTVDTLVDEADGSVTDGDISLRDAIDVAEVGDTIQFDSSLDDGTIVLTMGELVINKSLTIDATALPNGLTIDAAGNDPTPGEVNGDGSRIFSIADGTENTLSTVAINGLTLTGGDVIGDGGAIESTESLTVTDSTITGNSASGDGGGIATNGHYAEDVDLTINSSTISGNSAGGDGGGIRVFGFFSTAVNVDSSTITGNSGHGIDADGGYDAVVRVSSSTITGNSGNGIAAFGRKSGAYLTVRSTTISGNSEGGIAAFGVETALVIVSSSGITDNSGNGIAARASGGREAGASVTVRASAITGNLGHGIFSSGEDDGGVTVHSSTITGNSRSGIQGFSVFPYSSVRLNITSSTISGNLGGGVGAFGYYSSHVTIDSSTVSGNSVAGFGGGILARATRATVNITSSTISGNSATGDGGGVSLYNESYDSRLELAIENSIVAGNLAGGMGPDLHGAQPTWTSVRFSLIGDKADTSLIESQTPDRNGNLIGDSNGGGIINPLLGPLANNGGPTRTHALLPGSPAVNAGNPFVVDLPDHDQRGVPFARVSAGRIDMGAFESQIAPVDFDEDGQLDCADVDTLLGEISNNANLPDFDLTGNGLVDSADLDAWLTLAGLNNLMSYMPYLHGDANLDGKMDSTDLNVVGTNWQQRVSGWCSGDFNADGRVDSRDLNELAINWLEDRSSPAATADQRAPRAPLVKRAVPTDFDSISQVALSAQSRLLDVTAAAPPFEMRSESESVRARDARLVRRTNILSRDAVAKVSGEGEDFSQLHYILKNECNSKYIFSLRI